MLVHLSLVCSLCFVASYCHFSGTLYGCSAAGTVGMVRFSIGAVVFFRGTWHGVGLCSIEPLRSSCVFVSLEPPVGAMRQPGATNIKALRALFGILPRGFYGQLVLAGWDSVILNLYGL